MPRAVTSTRSVPLQAALDLGSRRLEQDREVGLEEVGAGLLDEPQAVELAVDLLALVEDDGQVARGLEDLLGDLSWTATPPFMSTVPRPTRSSPSRRVGRFAGSVVSGTVSM